MRKAAKVLAFFAVLAIITGLLRTYAPGPTAEEGRAAKAEDAEFAARQRDFKADALKARLAKCEVWVGMTEADLIKSWGSPSSTNSTTTASGETRQLVYRHHAVSGLVYRCGRDAVPERAYVYVGTNGIVTAIQTRE